MLQRPPLLPALFCLLSCLPLPLPPTSPCPRAPKEVCLSKGGRRSMFLRRRVRSIRISIILILFWLLEVRARPLCMFVLYCTLLLREKEVPANLQYQKVPTQFSLGIGLLNTKKYQPNINQKYQIGIQLYEFQVV